MIALTAFVSAFIGALVAILFRAAERLITKPIISVLVDRKQGCYGEAKYFQIDKDGNPTHEHPIWYLRLPLKTPAYLRSKIAALLSPKLANEMPRENVPLHRLRLSISVGRIERGQSTICGIYRKAPSFLRISSPCIYCRMVSDNYGFPRLIQPQ